MLYNCGKDQSGGTVSKEDEVKAENQAELERERESLVHRPDVSVVRLKVEGNLSLTAKALGETDPQPTTNGHFLFCCLWINIPQD